MQGHCQQHRLSAKSLSFNPLLNLLVINCLNLMVVYYKVNRHYRNNCAQTFNIPVCLDAVQTDGVLSKRNSLLIHLGVSQVKILCVTFRECCKRRFFKFSCPDTFRMFDTPRSFFLIQKCFLICTHPFSSAPRL